MKIDFNTVLLDLSDYTKNQRDKFTLEDAFKGVQAFGATGGGKSSGSGQALMRAYLRNGFGGLVLSAKSERATWIKAAKEEGRLDDLIIFCEPKPNEQDEIVDKTYYFNPLDYEATRLGGGEVFNIVNLFMSIYKMGRLISGEGLSSGGERFWDTALKRVLTYLISLLKLAGEPIDVANIYKLVSQLLNSEEVAYFNELQSSSEKDDAFERLLEWRGYNYYVDCYLKMLQAHIDFEKVNAENTDAILRRTNEIQRIKNYFENEFSTLASKTKTIIIESLLGLTLPFQSGILEKYCTGKTTLFPEETFEKGRIILVDFPLKNYLDSGLYIQMLLKKAWQESVERRKFKVGDIPVFLWVDESHTMLSEYDQSFATTARSAGVSIVFLTQNISNYYVAIGGKNPMPKANSLLGNLSTKIFHTNGDHITNEYASKIIGKSWQHIENFSVGQTQNFGMSKQFHWEIEPSRFSKLKSGGKRNNGQVEAIIVMNREFSNGKNYLIRTFQQGQK